MKQSLLLFALSILGITGAMAQDEQLSKEEKKELRQQDIQEQRNELMQTRHQVRIGVGALLKGEAWFEDDGFRRNIRGFAPLNIEYTYRVVEFLEVGGFFGMDFTNSDIESNLDYDDYVYKLHENYFNAGVFARYSWFNRKWVSLYSSVGVGVGYYYNTKTDIIDGYTPTESEPEFHFLPELTPIGIRVGRNFFGYFEPCAISVRGVALMCGVGYKF
ncbi:MAG: hypothetical protein R3Y49_03815 [Rikenellaceae bacterium]